MADESNPTTQRLERLYRYKAMFRTVLDEIDDEIGRLTASGEDPHAGCVGKTRYKTVERAGAAAQTAFERRGARLRAYQCPKCGDFHLTKMSGEDFVKSLSENKEA